PASPPAPGGTASRPEGVTGSPLDRPILKKRARNGPGAGTMAARMSVRSRRAPAMVVALIAFAAATVTGACSSLQPSGYQYVRNRTTGTYLKVPEQWTVYNQKAIETSIGNQQGGAGTTTHFPFISVFDETPHSELDFDV